MNSEFIIRNFSLRNERQTLKNNKAQQFLNS